MNTEVLCHVHIRYGDFLFAVNFSFNMSKNLSTIKVKDNLLGLCPTCGNFWSNSHFAG